MIPAVIHGVLSSRAGSGENRPPIGVSGTTVWGANWQSETTPPDVPVYGTVEWGTNWQTQATLSSPMGISGIVEWGADWQTQAFIGSPLELLIDIEWDVDWRTVSGGPLQPLLEDDELKGLELVNHTGDLDHDIEIQPGWATIATTVTGGQTATPAATTTKDAILNMLTHVETQQKVMMGIYMSDGSNPLKKSWWNGWWYAPVPAGNNIYEQYVKSIVNRDGKWPAVVGIRYKESNSEDAEIDKFDIDLINAQAYEAWQNGSLVEVSDQIQNPWFGGTARIKDTGNWAQLYTPGTAAYNRLHDDMDYVAEGIRRLKNLGVVVLMRPLHEFTGNWFFYGPGSSTAQQFKDLYLHYWNYYTNEKGLDNIIWVLGAASQNMDTFAERYPGDDYVDIVGYSYYKVDPRVDEKIDPQDPQSLTEYEALRAVAPNKPFALTELGPNKDDSNQSSREAYNERLLEALTTGIWSGGNCVYYLHWAGQTNTFALEFDRVQSRGSVVINDAVTWHGQSTLDYLAANPPGGGGGGDTPSEGSSALIVARLKDPVIKRLDAAWSSENAGGLLTGAIAPNTTYHVFLLRRESDGAINAAFDPDPDGANIPEGWSGRMIGSVVTDASGNIYQFVQVGSRFFWKSVVNDFSGNLSTSQTNKLALRVPKGINVSAQGVLQTPTLSSTASFYLDSGVKDNPYPNLVFADGEPLARHWFSLATDTNGRIFLSSSVANISCAVWTLSYDHPRGTR